MDLPTGKTILSGIQPSGTLHIGNYLGAIKQWVALQDDNTSYYCIVDEHAITVPYDPATLPERVLDAAALYLAAGVDPDKSIMFVQSHIPAHTELGWLLGTITPLGELERMTQFKDKTKKVEHAKKTIGDVEEFKKSLTEEILEEIPNRKELQAALDSEKVTPKDLKKIIEKRIDTLIDQETQPSLGLFAYPVLMAADILLYQTDLVPVGDDQTQHLELARNIAERFNKRFGETFVLPDVFINKHTARIMSLTDPTKKMSKSDAEKSYIALTDEPDVIRKKISSAVTETEPVFSFTESGPAVQNLLRIYQAFSGDEPAAIEQKFSGKSYKEFKEALAEVIIAELEPLQERYREIRESDDELRITLHRGKEKAQQVANATLQSVKEKMGLV